MKYLKVEVVFKEHPRHVSLAFQITGCPNRCRGCHTPELQEDIGKELTVELLQGHLERYRGLITNVIFFGGDQFREILDLLDVCHDYGVKTTLWTGACQVEEKISKRLDYLKTGNYDASKGPLGYPGSNQKYFEVATGKEIQIP